MATDNVITDAQILTSIIGPEEADFEPTIAESILRLKFSERQNDRMSELADRHNRGILTGTEVAELESYRRVGNFLSIMQSKARLSLKHSADGR
jgi:hypothetical protein